MVLVFIASRLSELRSCVVSVLCSVISATVSKLRPTKLPVFFCHGTGAVSLLNPVHGSASYCITSRIGPLNVERKRRLDERAHPRLTD